MSDPPGFDLRVDAQDGAHDENMTATVLGRVSVFADLTDLAKP